MTSKRNDNSNMVQLSKMEYRVIELKADGLADAEIAAKLKISMEGFTTLYRNILHKLAEGGGKEEKPITQ